METTPRFLDCWYLTGPTASGKTEVGLELADSISAEIISLDSMALYQYMDIGTAKPDDAARDRVRHHMLDVILPTEEYSLHDYVVSVEACVNDIRSRGKQVLFVGGTPLYLKALLRGIFVGPPADWDFREEVEREAKERGHDLLHQRLQLVDPLTAEKLHPHDRRRIIRALEVYKLTGTPLSHHQMQFEEGASSDKSRVFALQWDRSELGQRIEGRVDAMFEQGLRAEVEAILDRFEALSRTARQAVGYQETIAWIRGEAEFHEILPRIKTRTRQFAKRQETWFRSLSECRTAACDVHQSPAETARQIQLAGRTDH